MKKVLFSAALLSSISISGVVSANAEAPDLQEIKPLVQIHKDNQINGEALDLSGLSAFADEFVERHAESKTENTVSELAASGITYFETYAVGSSNVGWEAYPTLQASNFSTNYDHGGAQLRVAVLKIGYGNINDGILAGQRERPYHIQTLCGNDLHTCRAGETVVAFMYYFDFDGKQNGNFTNSAVSVASPYGSHSDSLYIL